MFFEAFAPGRVGPGRTGSGWAGPLISEIRANPEQISSCPLSVIRRRVIFGTLLTLWFGIKKKYHRFLREYSFNSPLTIGILVRITLMDNLTSHKMCNYQW